MGGAGDSKGAGPRRAFWNRVTSVSEAFAEAQDAAALVEDDERAGVSLLCVASGRRARW